MTIFLDIDGIMNLHKQYRNKYCGIDYNCMEVFNSLYSELLHRSKSAPEIVIISAWRYMILNQSMLLDGFRNLLYTHGLDIIPGFHIVNCIDRDVNIKDSSDRAKNIIKYIKEYDVDKYIIIDDLDLGYTELNLNFHKVDGTKGLTENDKTAILSRFS